MSKEQEWIELTKDFKGKLPIKGQVRGKAMDQFEEPWVGTIIVGIDPTCASELWFRGISWFSQARVLKEDYDKAMEGVEEAKLIRVPKSNYDKMKKDLGESINFVSLGLNSNQALEALEAKAEEVKEEKEKGFWLCEHNEDSTSKAVLYWDGKSLLGTIDSIRDISSDWTRIHKMVKEKSE